MNVSRIALTIALAGALTASAARGDDRATAQQLFQEGKALMRAGKLAAACPKFAGAADLSQTAGVRLNLGDCYDKLGRTASAWTRYEEALTLAERAGDASAADVARTRLAALKPRLSYLTVKVPPEAALAGLAVARDGDAVANVAWATPVPVDPGEHEVKANAPGHVPWSWKESLNGSGERVVTIPVLAVQEAPPSAAKAPVTSDQAPTVVTAPVAPQRPGLFAGEGGTQRTLAVVGAGLGVVGVALGSYFGEAMLSRKSEYQQHQDPSGRCLDVECQTASHLAVAAGNVATAAFVAGGLLLGTGAVLWLTAPPRSEAAPSAALAVLAGPQNAGVGVTGRW